MTLCYWTQFYCALDTPLPLNLRAGNMQMNSTLQLLVIELTVATEFWAKMFPYTFSVNPHRYRFYS